jgi:trehalose synthase
MTSLQEYQPEFTLSIDEYEPYVGRERIEELKQLAAPLGGKSWAHLNSTLAGGGVAEMLQRVIPLARNLGLDAHWYVIWGNDKFFRVTKKFHNMLQGLECPITLEEIFDAYLDTIAENAKPASIVSDLVIIHDPQPAALVMNGLIFGNILWRCHIDTSAPNKTIWRFLLPYINHCAGAIFTMPEFVGPGLQIPLYQMNPCIDPLSLKNHSRTREQAIDTLTPLLKEDQVDPDRPILAAISRYDIHKNQESILKAFQRLREQKQYDPPPYLIFLGNTASDDPEGGAMLTHLRQLAGDDPDIRFWVNVENNDAVVGSLMHLARGFVHISTREGFGLVVSEALWQGTPVIGSARGGITKQVLDGETGYLVNPLDIETTALRMAQLLDNPAEARALGQRGKEHVRRSFLLPELVRRYLVLSRFHMGASREIPDFRLDHLSYTEIIQAVRAFHPYLPPVM